MLPNFQFKVTPIATHFDARSVKGVGNGVIQRHAITDLSDGLHRRGQIRAVARKHRRVSAHLWAAGWRLNICAEVVVEAPIA